MEQRGMNDLLTLIHDEFTSCLGTILPEPVAKNAETDVEVTATLRQASSQRLQFSILCKPVLPVCVSHASSPTDLSKRATHLTHLIKDLEIALSAVRLKELRKEEVALQEEIALLHQDISLKSSTITQYMAQLGRWGEELQTLEEQSALVVRREGAKKGKAKAGDDGVKQDVEMKEEDEDDEGEGDVFEEV